MFDILRRYAHLVILPIRGFGSCHNYNLLINSLIDIVIDMVL
jgi:hypothetical protein